MGQAICVRVGWTEEMNKLMRKKIISAVSCGKDELIVARHGVNRGTLKKIAKRILKNNVF